MKKKISLLSIVLFAFFTSWGQNERFLTIPKGGVTNTFFTRNTSWDGSHSVELYLSFEGGTDYILTGNPGSKWDSTLQHNWNKVVKLQTNDKFGSENYVTVGWRYYNPNEGEEYFLQLGYYSHRDGNKNREWKCLGNFERYTAIKCELAITKDYMFVQIEDHGVHIHRKADTYDDCLNKIEGKLVLWYGDNWWSTLGDKNSDKNPAMEKIDVKVTDVKWNENSYWSCLEAKKAPILSICNSLYQNGQTQTYQGNGIIIGDYLDTNPGITGVSYFPEYPVYKQNGTFTSFAVFQSGSTVSFLYEDEVEIKPGTSMEYGSTVIIKKGDTEILKSENIDTEDFDFEKNIISKEEALFKNVDETAFGVQQVELEVFPNPTNDFLFINNNKFDITCDIEIYNTSGQLIFIENEIVPLMYKVDFTNQPAGVYHYRLRYSENIIYHGQIIKQ